MEVAVEAAEGQVETRQGEGCTEPRADGVFRESVVAGEMRGTDASGESQPAERVEFIFDEKCGKTAGRMFRDAERTVAAVVEYGSKALVIGLVETVFADLQTVLRESRAQTDLSPDIAGGAILRRGNGKVRWQAGVIRRVVMIEGRNGHQGFRVEGVDPGKIQERVGFVITVPQADGGVLSVFIFLGARRGAVL